MIDQNNHKFTYPTFPPIHKNEKHFQRYLKFIESRKHRQIDDSVYTEKHHIIPRNLDGSDEPENIIVMTAREHFIAHMILWKAYGGSMATAFWNMTHTKSLKLTSRMFAVLREQHASYVSSTQKGKPKWTEKDKELMSIRARNRPQTTIETRVKISQSSKTWHYGLSEKEKRMWREKISKAKVESGYYHNKETRQKISDKLTGKPGGKKPKHWCENMSRVHKGKTVSKETREKLSKHVMGKKWVHTFTSDGAIVRKQVRKDDVDKYIDNGWNKGKGVVK